MTIRTIYYLYDCNIDKNNFIYNSFILKYQILDAFTVLVKKYESFHYTIALKDD